MIIDRKAPIMDQRTAIALVMALVSGVAAFVVMLVLDNGTTNAAIFAVLAAAVSGVVSYVQTRNRR